MINFDDKIPEPFPGLTNDRLHFFKYMSESTAKIALENRTLRWSNRSQFNDPFEMQFDLSLKADKNIVRERALERLWELYNSDQAIEAGNILGLTFEMLRRNRPGLSKDFIFEQYGPAIDEGMEIIVANKNPNIAMLEPMFADIKILSLTVRPDITLMWSHYANSHKGVAFRLRSIPGLNSPYGMAKPVVYTSEPYQFFNEEYLVNTFAGLQSMDVNAITDAIIYRKPVEWAYEQEWRISSGVGRNKSVPYEDINFGLNELDGVIFGLMTSDSDKTAIREICAKYPNVEFMQASKVPGLSTLDINVID